MGVLTSRVARSPWSAIVCLLAVTAAAASCSGDSEPDAASDPDATTSVPTSSTTSSSTTTTTTTTAPAVAPVVIGPVVGPTAPTPPQPATALPAGYVEEEFFVGGTASSFAPVGDLAGDGLWTIDVDGEADFLTRILVRRPAAERFSGVVVVEWLNVTAIEAAPDWGYLFEEIAHAGHAYVAVSAQAIGVMGGETLMQVDVEVDADEEPPPAGGLVNIDPDRYGDLVHPGDAFAYDIYTQVGRTLAENAGAVLGDLEATSLLAAGQSQSAGFLTSYVNAVHPHAGVYDGFLVHSRGGGAAPLDGGFGDDSSFVDEAVRIRSDLDTPVFMVQAETDLTLLGYFAARQYDTDQIRTWELAGTAHADAHVVRAIIGGPRTGDVGNFVGCAEPINSGPHHEGVQAALRHLAVWAAGGPPPPVGERIAMTAASPTIIRDELGIALGGVRNPLVDVPVVVTSGDPWPASLPEDGGLSLCALFGRTTRIEAAGLRELHGDAEAYLAAFDRSVETAVADGFLLDIDAEQLRAEARDNVALFTG